MIRQYHNIFHNLLFPTIIFLISEKLMGYIFYMKIFPQSWISHQDLFRPMSDSHWLIGMPIVTLVYGAVISILYVKLSERLTKDLSIFCFSLKLFIISRFFGEIYNYMMFPYGIDLMITGMIHGFFTLLLWAVITQKIFKITK